MPLSCGCNYDGDYSYYFEIPSDYSTLNTSRRVRCVSCKSLIDVGDTIVSFTCYREPNSDIEERIYHDEVPIANKRFCERCGDLYFSLYELGFECVSPDDNMLELVKEYRELVKELNKGVEK